MFQTEAIPRVGEQLELELAGPGRAWREPWWGMNPRVLTRAFQTFSLGAPPAGGLHADASVICTEINQEQRLQLLLPFARRYYHGSR